MGTTVALVAALLLPTALGYAVVAVARARHWFANRPVVPAPVPIERLRADLCRLHAQLDAVETANDLFGKNLRVNAVRAAYVDTLCLACRQVGVTPPEPAGRTVVPLAEIYRAEAALRGHGLDVRGVGSR